MANTLGGSSICLVLELGALGVNRKVATSEIDTRGADPDAVSVSKEILTCKSYDRLLSAQGDLKRWVRSLALPSQLFTRGSIYLIPVGLVEQVDERIRFERDRILGAGVNGSPSLLDSFMSDYDSAVESARVRLGPLFDPTDYPAAFRVRRSFKVAHSYLSLDTPGQLAEISPEIFQREREKAEARIATILEEVEGALAATMQDLVSHMLDRLNPGADGKPKIFRNSLVENFSEFLATFTARNASGNTDLEGIANRCRSILAGVDADALRSVPVARAAVVAGMAEVKAALDTMIAARPSRMFS